MKSNNTSNIIRTFFEKDASEKTQFLFRKWFRLEENQAEKEKYMEELWEVSPAAISTQTLDDLSKIKALISEETPAKPSYSLFKNISAYAAVITLLVATSVYLTYYFTKSSQLEYTQLSVSNGERKKITLSDGSIVTVNAGSTLIYPKIFSANTRTIFLTGEANFSVAKNASKPFIVKTKYLDVRALGTKFNVQSYPNAEYTRATLIEGSVKVDMGVSKNKSNILKPNEQLTYSHKDSVITVAEVDAAKIASWEDGYLIFQGVKFKEIASTLERKYNVEINYDNKKLDQQAYVVKFNPSESLEDVLNVLCQLIDSANYKINGSTVYFNTK